MNAGEKNHNALWPAKPVNRWDAKNRDRARELRAKNRGFRKKVDKNYRLTSAVKTNGPSGSNALRKAGSPNGKDLLQDAVGAATTRAVIGSSGVRIANLREDPMKNDFRIARWTLAGLLCCSFLAGCIVAPARPYYGGEVVAVAPPAPRVEIVGVAPAPGYLWIGGYWGWAGGRHEWVAGHWEAPRPGYRWAPHAWVREEHGWRSQPGHWERHG